MKNIKLFEQFVNEGKEPKVVLNDLDGGSEFMNFGKKGIEWDSYAWELINDLLDSSDRNQVKAEGTVKIGSKKFLFNVGINGPSDYDGPYFDDEDKKIEKAGFSGEELIYIIDSEA